MDLTKLRYFVTAASCGSFTETAQRLYTSQPNISKQISSMERELGVQLFFRDNHAIRLTKAGEYLYEQTKDMPAQFERMLETTRAIGRSDIGELTVGVLAGQKLRKDVILSFQRFNRMYPEIGIWLEQAGFSELQRALDSLRFDLILTFSFDIRPREGLRIESVKRMQEPAIFVSRMSPLVELEDFSKAPYVVISPKESYGGYEQLLRSCRARGFEPNIVRTADSLDSLLFYVETGVGIAVLDRNTRLESDQNIRVIPIEDSDTPDLVAVWLERNTNPSIRKLVECLKADA